MSRTPGPNVTLEQGISADSRAAAVRLLVIDDDEQTLMLVAAGLSTLPVEVITVTDPVEGLDRFFQLRPHAVLVDLFMPQLDGIEVLKRIIERDPGADVILMSGHYSPESAVEAIHKGAADYLSKPLDMSKLRERVSALIAQAQLRQRANALENELLTTFQFQSIVGRSPAMLEVFATISRAAPHYRTALITGATGTGKEKVAHALHNLSPVSRKQFAICNCSALTDTLYESELFGYVRGAFTGATHDKIGLFEYANGGTVFLDEIGDMPLPGQAKLLRVLQNQEIQRVGSPAVKRIDIRVVAATNRDLRALVAAKQFREDLYYRLSMIEIKLPSLSQRLDDLRLLQRHFVERFSNDYNKQIRGLTRRAQKLLAEHHWPGNVRELENVIGNACMMVRGDVIDVLDLPEYLRVKPESGASGKLLSMQQIQRQHAMCVLEAVGGNKARASVILGISRTSLYRLLESGFDVDRQPARESVTAAP